MEPEKQEKAYQFFIEDENESALYMIYHRMIELNNPDIPFLLENKEDCFLLNKKHQIISPDDAQNVRLNIADFIQAMNEIQENLQQ